MPKAQRDAVMPLSLQTFEPASERTTLFPPSSNRIGSTPRAGDHSSASPPRQWGNVNSASTHSTQCCIWPCAFLTTSWTARTIVSDEHVARAFAISCRKTHGYSPCGRMSRRPTPPTQRNHITNRVSGGTSGEHPWAKVPWRIFM